MSHFKTLPEFAKEFARLARKYPSLAEDLTKLEKLLAINPVGIGTNFVTIHQGSDVKIVKTRLACKSLKNRSIRVIYAHHEDSVTFVYIEIYFKGDKENEERERVKQYLIEVE